MKRKHTTINDIKISENFSLSEFQSRDTKTVKLDPELLNKLQELRNLLGKRIDINSGYRTKEHNKKVGGVPNSRHTRGRAVDISVNRKTIKEIIYLANWIKFKTVIYYPKKHFIHLDIGK